MGPKFLMFHVKSSENVSPDTFESAVVTNWSLAFRSPAIVEFRLATKSPMIFTSPEQDLKKYKARERDPWSRVLL